MNVIIIINTYKLNFIIFASKFNSNNRDYQNNSPFTLKISKLETKTFNQVLSFYTQVFIEIFVVSLESLI
ncbi:hypothetical protein [Staphylococcus sp. GDY8P64P]|uniref:hypothetical protein n=1 Tax=Staphylococcus sp. GDY8P64P TaxID=2804423 RepID=UPI001950540E|nr:hypothetical protein [Staphylococcus sp. GDY8P64P]